MSFGARWHSDPASGGRKSTYVPLVDVDVSWACAAIDPDRVKKVTSASSWLQQGA